MNVECETFLSNMHQKNVELPIPTLSVGIVRQMAGN